MCLSAFVTPPLFLKKKLKKGWHLGLLDDGVGWSRPRRSICWGLVFVYVSLSMCLCLNLSVSQRPGHQRSIIEMFQHRKDFSHGCICVKRDLSKYQKRPIQVPNETYPSVKETYLCVKRDPFKCQKRPVYVANGPINVNIATPQIRVSVKRDLFQRQKRPISVSKETYSSVKRDLCKCQTRPVYVLQGGLLTFKLSHLRLGDQNTVPRATRHSHISHVSCPSHHFWYQFFTNIPIYLYTYIPICMYTYIPIYLYTIRSQPSQPCFLSFSPLLVPIFHQTYVIRKNHQKYFTRNNLSPIICIYVYRYICI